jgi:hypothetical protein
MEALPGTNPSPAQMAEAMQMAAAARSGDQAGAATPPGFVMKILGLTGAVPDTLAFLRYVDQQVSRFALAGFLDLGSSETGSRALGQSFIDLFLLNVSTIGMSVADTVTRQVAAKIVEWNFGDRRRVGSRARSPTRARRPRAAGRAGREAAAPARFARARARRRRHRSPRRE